MDCNVPRDLVTVVKRAHKKWNAPRPHSHLSLQSIYAVIIVLSRSSSSSLSLSFHVTKMLIHLFIVFSLPGMVEMNQIPLGAELSIYQSSYV